MLYIRCMYIKQAGGNALLSSNPILMVDWRITQCYYSISLPYFLEIEWKEFNIFPFYCILTMYVFMSLAKLNIFGCFYCYIKAFNSSLLSTVLNFFSSFHFFFFLVLFFMPFCSIYERKNFIYDLESQSLNCIAFFSKPYCWINKIYDTLFGAKEIFSHFGVDFIVRWCK